MAHTESPAPLQGPRPIGPYTFEEFKERAAAFHGYPAPGLLIGGYMVEMARRGLPEGTLFEAVIETRKCLPDAVQILTLCSVGNQWMKIVNLGRYALALFDKYTGEGFRVFLDVDKLAAWPQIRGWYLKLTPKKEQDTDLLFEEISHAGDSICTVNPVRVASRLLGHSHMSRIDRCPICREAYPVSDGAICRGCQGEAPYESAAPSATLGEACIPARAVPVAEIVGRKALHDMTRIVPGRSKGPEFTAGQTFTGGDVCRLQHMGRNLVYVEDEARLTDEWVHENEAALAFARRMAGPGVTHTQTPKEGKIDFYAERTGLLSIDRDGLARFNLVPDVMCATRQGDSLVEKGRIIAGTRAIPLFLSREGYSRALSALGEGPLLEILPLREARLGILVTGTEVFQGLIEDKFDPVIRSKAQALGSIVVGSEIVPDDREAIAAGVSRLLAAGADLIVTTAGLSVDPEDVTRKGLLDAGLTDMLYGAPILPGAMTLVGRIGKAQVLGVPACALFHKTTSLDLLLPRLLAGKPITRQMLAAMAEGSLCLSCNACTYPKCPFGK
jgi:formylmethanofuran dehydrogenase subunit E